MKKRARRFLSSNVNFNAKIEGGKLLIEQETKWKRYLSGLNENTLLSVSVEKRKNKRSISQNSYYWLYLDVIENETGNTAYDLHELFKRKFLRPVTKTILGEEIKLPASTTNLSKVDFGDYLDKISALVEIPLPDPEAAGFITNY